MNALLQKWGNSIAVKIPSSIAEKAGLHVGEPVRLTRLQSGLLISPVRTPRHIKLSDLLAQCKGRNPHRELIRGKSRGELF